MARPQPSSPPFTYADYLGWPDDERYELIEGQALAMAPAPTVRHQRLVGEVHRQLATALLRQPCEALVAPIDVTLFAAADVPADRVTTVVQPDVLIVCDPTKVSTRGAHGAPDWVLEVLSPRSAGHDSVTKRRLYEQAGVREYWLVHPIDRVLTAYSLGADGRYGRPHVQMLEGETPLATLPGLVIDWTSLELPDAEP